MSRKGKLPISLPKGVEVKQEGIVLSVKGPKGTLTQKVLPMISIDVKGEEVVVGLKKDEKENAKYHGLYRTLVSNMVEGTTKGFEKSLEMIGVGYRAAVQGNMLDLQVGFSHPTKLPIPEGLKVEVQKNTTIVISGCDKALVGQFAADIRSVRPPEPYQGKGIRYKGEYVRKKAGKAAAKSK